MYAPLLSVRRRRENLESKLGEISEKVGKNSADIKAIRALTAELTKIDNKLKAVRMFPPYTPAKNHAHRR